MTLSNADPMGPTLDHIVPVSHQLFPDHSVSNLQLAHRICNSIASDKRVALLAG